MKCRHGHEHPIVGPSGPLTRYLVPFELSPGRLMFGMFLKWSWGLLALITVVVPIVLYNTSSDPSDTQLKWLTIVFFLVFGLAFFRFLKATSDYPKHIGYFSVEPDEILSSYSFRVRKEKGCDVYSIKVGRHKLYGINSIEPFEALRETLKGQLKD